MISGSLFLFYKKDMPIKLLYRKYIPCIFIKILIWAALYSIILYRTIAVSRVLYFSVSSHLYFLYIIVLLYVITPILSFILKRISRQVLLYFLVFGVAFTTFCSYMFNTVPHNKFIVLCILCNEILKYIGYYILGYYISLYGINNIVRRLIYCCAIICFFYIILKTSSVTKTLDTVINVNPRTPLAYLSGLNTILTTALFIFCKHLCEKLSFTFIFKQNISVISNLTLGIYLIHNLFIYCIASRIKILGPAALYVPVMSFLIFIFSMLVIFLLKKIPVLRNFII